MAGVIRIVIPDRADLMRTLKRPMQAAADKAVAIIRERTARGLTMHGQPMRAYTKGYAERKRETGRSDAPNLTLTGELLNNLKRKSVSSDGRSAVIGFEGSHRDTRFERVASAYARFQHVGRDERTGRAKGSDGRFLADYARIDGAGKKMKSGFRAGFTLKRLASTTPYAVIVPALQRQRPFFGIVLPREIAEIVATYQRVLDEEIARMNAQTRSRTGT